MTIAVVEKREGLLRRSCEVHVDEQRSPTAQTLCLIKAHINVIVWLVGASNVLLHNTSSKTVTDQHKWSFHPSIHYLSA